jgi:hypothetical protein
LAELDTAVNTNNATSWDPQALDRVEAIAVSDSTVFAGGNFATIGGKSRGYIAGLDTTIDTDNALEWAPNATHPVRSLTVADSMLIVGGNFGGIAGTRRPHFAVFELGTQPTETTGSLWWVE